jgi:iron-sulfur cluster assembly protein
MFGIPGKQAITLTNNAVKQVVKLMGNEGHKGLRIGVKKVAVQVWNTLWNT